MDSEDTARMERRVDGPHVRGRMIVAIVCVIVSITCVLLSGIADSSAWKVLFSGAALLVGAAAVAASRFIRAIVLETFKHPRAFSWIERDDDSVRVTNHDPHEPHTVR